MPESHGSAYFWQSRLLEAINNIVGAVIIPVQAGAEIIEVSTAEKLFLPDYASVVGVCGLDGQGVGGQHVLPHHQGEQQGL